jgi:hypothetical protein
MDLSPAILGAGAIGALVIAIIFLVGMTKKWGMLVPCTGMMLFGAMALPLTWNDRVKPTIWLPIQTQRSTLFLAFGCLGMLMLLIQARRLRGKAIPISALMLLLAGVYASLLRVVHNDPLDGAQSIFLSVMTLVPLLFTASAVIDSFDDLRVLIRVVAALGVIWLGMTGLQIVVNPTLVTMGNEFRFVGLFSNPQHSGVFMAFLCVSLLWLTMNDLKRYKLIYLGMLGISSVLLLWTGSRTGLGMAIIGVSATLYSRVGRAILVLPLVALVGYIGLKVMVDVLGITFGVERLASTANTRDYAWWKLYSVGLESPLFGVGTEDAEKSENSWLYGFASYGIGMLALLLMMALTGTIEIIKSFRARFSVPGEYRNYFDFLNGMMLMYFAGAVLEGYMISRVSSTLAFFMIAAVANANLRKLAKYGWVDEYEMYDDYSEDAYSSYDQFSDYGDGEYAPDHA